MTSQTRALLLVLLGGLVAGTFDITYACLFWGLKAGVAAERIFQSVAKGLLGPASFSRWSGHRGARIVPALLHRHLDVLHLLSGGAAVGRAS